MHSREKHCGNYGTNARYQQVRIMAVILIVEDDANQRILYDEELQRCGYRVKTACDGHEALLLIEDEMPDLVVLDIAMPGMDGLDLMSRMIAKCHRLPIIINTAYAFYLHNMRTWSADACVVKSSDLSELIETIQKVLLSRGTTGPPEPPTYGAVDDGIRPDNGNAPRPRQSR